MTSEEFRTNPLLLRNQFKRTGMFEIPLIAKAEISLENLSLVGYDKISSGNSGQVVHFFLDDYKFESIWNNPEPRIEKLSTFKAVLSPQFSIYSEMPLAVQIYNTFRSRWCGAYLQSKGITVIPSVVWGEPDTFWFCFDGIEKGSVVAVSTVGIRNEKNLFMAGYYALIKRIEPLAVICYGKPFEEMSGNIIYVSYEETNNYHSKDYIQHLVHQIPQIPRNLTYEKGGGHAFGGNQFPKNASQIKHIFRNKNGHVDDTPENRSLFSQACNNENNYVGTDKYGKRWYAQILPDGRQVWVATRDGIIQDCGINDNVRFYDSEEGFCRGKSKGVLRKMENTSCRKAFLAAYHFLDDLYSRFPYSNLGLICSEMNPYLFKDGMSADPAAWKDFCEYYEEAKNAYCSEFDTAYYTTLRFLRIYEDEWGYPIPYVLEAFTSDEYQKFLLELNQTM